MRPPAASLARPAVAIAIAGAGGWLVSRTGLPLAWMMGAMLAMTAASFLRAPVEQPTAVMDYVKSAVGTMLGASLTYEVVAKTAEWWSPLLVLIAGALVAGATNYALLRRLVRFDRRSATLCAMPGGIAEMILLGAQAGADPARVAIIHALRIALSILIVPLLVVYFAGVHIDRGANTLAAGSMSLEDWLWFALCIVAGVLAKHWTRLPAPTILVPLAVSAAIHLSGLTHFTVPSGVLALVQVFIGIGVGARFLGLSVRALMHAFAAALTVVGIQIAVALAAAGMLSRDNAWDFTALMLAYAPGGLAEMSLIAVTLGRDVAFVGFHHIVRVLASLGLAPVLLKRAKRLDEQEAP